MKAVVFNVYLDLISIHIATWMNRDYIKLFCALQHKTLELGYLVSFKSWDYAPIPRW